MSASMSREIRAEPNLTPLLDVVFQLITFFMLVINFSNENYDARVRLPVAGSARPVEEGEKAATEDRLVLNVDRQGHLLMNGEVLTATKALQEIKHQADLVKLNLKARRARSPTPPAACRRRSSSAPTATRRSRRSTP